MNQMKFVVDLHLEKLGRMLRMMGFDTINAPSNDDEDLIQIANEQRRFLLTRDRGIVNSPSNAKVYFVKSLFPKKQLREIVESFDLIPVMRPLTRCLECNAVLIEVKKLTVKGKVPPKIFSTFEVFFSCESCQRVYWHGSHYEKMLADIDDIKKMVSHQ